MQQRRPHIRKHAWKARYPTCFPAVAGLFAGVVVGCARPTSSPSTGVVRGPASEVARQDSAASLPPTQLIYQPGQLRYRLQISSAVQVTAGDSTHRVDSTRVAGDLDVRFTRTLNREEITAEVRSDSMVLTVGTGTSVPMVSGPLLVFHIDLRTGRIAPNELTGDTFCGRDSSQQSPFSGREVLPSIQLQTVGSWVDTSVTTTCRDSVLLILTRVASYLRLQSSDNTQQLVRSTRVMVSGTGYQWGQKVDVSGEGTATDTLHLDGSPLRLQESVGSSHLRLQFRAPLKTQEFVQSMTTRVRLQH